MIASDVVLLVARGRQSWKHC